jgi:hypothetical protein
MRMLVLHLQQKAGSTRIRLEPEGPEAQQWLAAGLSANSQLLQLNPSAAILHSSRVGLM